MQYSRTKGFTLVELLLVIVVLSILVAIAVPSFRTLMDRNRVTTMANDLLADILLARSEAIKREKVVVVRRNASTWSKKGWMVFINEDKDSSYTYSSDNDLLLRSNKDGSFAENNKDISIAGEGKAKKYIAFNSRGRLVSAFTTSSDYLKIEKGDAVRYICFSPTGRPRIQEDSCS